MCKTKFIRIAQEHVIKQLSVVLFFYCLDQQEDRKDFLLRGFTSGISYTARTSIRRSVAAQSLKS